MVWYAVAPLHERAPEMDTNPHEELLKAAAEAGDKVTELLRRLNARLEKELPPAPEKNGVAYSNGTSNGRAHHEKD